MPASGLAGRTCWLSSSQIRAAAGGSFLLTGPAGRGGYQPRPAPSRSGVPIAALSTSDKRYLERCGHMMRSANRGRAAEQGDVLESRWHRDARLRIGPTQDQRRLAVRRLPLKPSAVTHPYSARSWLANSPTARNRRAEAPCPSRDQATSGTTNSELKGLRGGVRRVHSIRRVSLFSVGESGKRWCPGTESNCLHTDFQSVALPVELPGLILQLQ